MHECWTFSTANMTFIGSQKLYTNLGVGEHGIQIFYGCRVVAFVV